MPASPWPSDYEGDPKSFALVVPVPTVVQENDIRVVDTKLIDKLDAYSAAPDGVFRHRPLLAGRRHVDDAGADAGKAEPSNSTGR